MQAALLGIVAGIGLGLYWTVTGRPKPSRLHKINQKKAKRFLSTLQNQPHEPSELFGLLRRANCFVFEELLLVCFQQRGFRIKRNRAYTGDGGIDGTFFDRAGNKFLIQAKRYKSAINPRHVSEFAEVIQREQAAGGFFIHTGRTGPKSYQNQSPQVRIISGHKLLRLLRANMLMDGK